jgi:hypothetical protein
MGRDCVASVGDAVRLAWPAQALHLFDRDSGQRIGAAA